MTTVSTVRGGGPGGVTGAPEAGLASTAPLVAFRAAVLRRSVPVLAVTVTVLAAATALDGTALTQPTLWLLVAALAGLVLATRIRWEDETDDSWAPLTWIVVAHAVLGGLALFTPLDSMIRPLFAGVVVMSGLVLSRIRHAIATVLALALVAGSHVMDGAVAFSSYASPLGLVFIASVVAGLAGRQLEESGVEVMRRVDELEWERESYRRLYALASSLGSSSSPEETLPVLLERMCRYLGSGFGAWLVADENTSELRVVEPVFSEGRETPLDLPAVSSRNGAFVARAFRSDKPITISNATLKREREGVLGVLGLGTAMAAPLIVDGRRIGVLLVGDPASGSYAEQDARELEVMARPASLVVSQLVLHERAHEVAESLREIADIKSDFVSVVSHELRTPLTSIRGALDTLRRPEVAGQPQLAVELVDSASRQTARLERLIEDLLVASRVDRGTLQATLLPVDLSEVLDEVLPTIDSDLIVTDSGPGSMAMADPDQLGQVVRNLVENAIKYSEGSVIEVRTERRAYGVDLLVVDHGPGIPVEHRDRVFERFTQLQRPHRRSAGGSGLGLSIVAALVDAMGARIRLEETPGGGATFRVSFRTPAAAPVPV